MSSRKDSLAAMERRVRRLAGRRNYDMLKPQNPDSRVLAHGGYMLRDAATSDIVFGDKSYKFSATLDEVEEYLLALDRDEDA